MWLRILLITICFTCVAPAAVTAQDDAARAIELVSQANDLYDAGDFRPALEKYRQAYQITEDPRVLYRIGITYENLANYQRAREHLELYLLAEPDSKYSGRVKSKIDNLRNLEENLQAAVRIETQPPGASVWMDIETGRPAGVTPVRVPVGPGSHRVLIRKEGFEDVTDTFEVGAGETVDREYDLGSGSAVVAETPEETGEETPEETAATTEEAPDATVMAGEPSRVQIGPSAGIAALSWLSIAVGWALVATSGVFVTGVGYADGGLIGTGFFAGAGLVALGAYFLWFRDYTKDLPPAQTGALQPPGQRVVGIGIRF